MRNSCAVCSLAVALCLVVCVSGSTAVNKADATTAVANAKQSVTAVCARAQSELNKAKGLLDTVESSKNKAEDAKVKSQKAPQDNTDAVEIAKSIKSLLDEVDKLYATEKQKLEEAVNSLNTLLSDAQKVNGKPDITIEPDTESSEDYTVTNGKAEAAELDGRIDTAIAPIAGVGDKAEEMETKTKQAQLKDAHVSVIVAVATIDTILGKADTIIGQIEEKKNTVSVIVDEMKKLKTNHPTVSDDNINALLQNADNALTAATGALDNANSARAAIQTQKGIANAALTNVKTEKQEVSNAQQDANTAEASVATVQQSFSQLQSELQIADNSLTNANNLKQQLQTALSTATSATRTEQSVANPEVRQLQDTVSTAIQTIQSMMGPADSNLQETENHKQKVHDIVQEMKTLSTTEFIEANENIKMLYSKADNALTNATGAVKNAKQAKTDMTAQKQKADDALSRVATAKDVETAQKEVDITNACVSQANQFAATINTALQTAKDSVTKANDARQKLQTALSTTTSAPTPEEVKETEKTNPPVEQRTEPDQKDTTMQPTSKDLPDQTDNSADKLKDALIKGAQNVPTTALTGEKAPAPGAKNDSAMIVSVPLLVALIASAVWQ